MKDKTKIGDKIGRLTIKALPKHDPYKPQLAVCDCECGNTTTANLASIRFGNTLSCGCIRRETAAARKLKHGYAAGGRKTSEYQIWKSMKQRCGNPKNAAYKNYGGRGIKVCRRGISSFENFLKDMGRRPSANHSIDRINNNLGYSPSNCRWVTSRENCNNKRNCLMLTFKGETMSASDWAMRLGLNPETFRDRFSYGWPLEKIFSPTKNKPHQIKTK